MIFTSLNVYSNDIYTFERLFTSLNVYSNDIHIVERL